MNRKRKGRQTRRRSRPEPVELPTYVRRSAVGLRRRVVNLEIEVDNLLNDILPYRAQLNEADTRFLLEALAFGHTRLGGLFPKWTGRFTHRTVRDVTPRRRLLRAACGVQP